jgi:autotransporter-associated beta strand protein
LQFQNNASAGQATIVANGSNLSGWSGGTVTFNTTSTVNNTSVTLHGATVLGGNGATAEFINGARAGASTITANGGSNGGTGAKITFNSGARGDTAKLIANAGASVDFLDQRLFGDGSTTVGSIEGAGSFFLRGSHLIAGTRNTSTTVSGPITDGSFSGGRLTKVGSGVLTLDGANAHSGLTTVAAGTLAVNGSIAGGVAVNSGATLAGSGTIAGPTTVADGGILAPGNSPGALRTGALTLSPNSVLNIEFGTVSDFLTVNGNLTLDGILNILPGDGFNAFGRDFFTYSGTLTNNGLTIGSVPAGFGPSDFSLDFSTPGEIAILGPSTTIAGDYNLNGVVDAADYTLYRDALGTNTSLPNDTTPGSVNTADYTVWANNFTAGPSAAAAVPEPAAIVLLLPSGACGCLLSWIARRRRASFHLLETRA